MIKLVGLIAKQSVGDKFVVNFLPPSNQVQKNDKNLKNVNDLEKSGYKRQALIYLSFTWCMQDKPAPTVSKKKVDICLL